MGKRRKGNMTRRDFMKKVGKTAAAVSVASPFRASRSPPRLLNEVMC